MWWRWFLGDRLGPVRWLALPCAALDVVVFELPGVSPWTWFFVFLSAVASLGAGFRPLLVTTVQCGLILGAALTLSTLPVTITVLGTLAMVELTVRGRPLAVATGILLATAVFLPLAEGPPLAKAYGWVWGVLAPVLVGGYLRELRENARQSRLRAEDSEARRELAEQTTRLAERQAIARELHDVVAHHVASIALRVGVARHVLGDSEPRAREVLDDVHAASIVALADLRHLVGALRDQKAGHADLVSLLVEPTELPAALEALVSRAAQAGLAVDARIDPGISRLDAVRGLVVLRLVQEGLTNVIKHAHGPASLRVTRQDDGAARIEVRNTATTPGATGPAGEGHGLIGLAERVAMVGGLLDVGREGADWRLLARIPA